MFDFKITLDCTSRFESAVYRLAEMVLGAKHPEPAQPDVAAAPEPAPVTTAATQQPVSTPQNVVPFPAAPAAPESVSAPAAVPVSNAPAYTLEQVSSAGASLISSNPAKATELRGLLAQFGVPAVAALKPEQLGAFATALRGLGANI